MADAWTRQSMTLGSSAQEKKHIETISRVAERLFGRGTYDTSVQDTALLAHEVFPQMRITPEYGVSQEKLVEYIQRGDIVIAPMDGRVLRNPHYTAPGPEYHMLVILGYEAQSQTFITHDPGTRYGAGYRYPVSRLYTALRDYPTGDHEKVTTIQKNILVVER
jgi:hypothetical protein